MIIIRGANNGLGLELTKIFLHNNFDVNAISKGKNNLSSNNLEKTEDENDVSNYRWWNFWQRKRQR